VDLVAPVVIQAAAGAGHWAAGRRQRALAEWAGAAGFGLVAWGLSTEAATAAEVREDFQRQLRDLARERGIEAPATPRPETAAARRIERFFRWLGLVSPVASVVISVPWRLRHPRRLTGLAIASEAPARGAWWHTAASHPKLPRGRFASADDMWPLGSLEQVLRGPSATPEGYLNLFGGLKRTIAKAGYSDLKEFQKVGLIVTG